MSTSSVWNMRRGHRGQTLVLWALWMVMMGVVSCSALPGTPRKGTIIHEWVQMDYDWQSMGEDRNEWIASGRFIAQNCVLAGIKVWKNTTFVTIPRWAPGVPATLNTIVEVDGVPLLRPFPPVQDQLINTTNGLKNVQDIEIDPYGRMWIIDTGMMNMYFPDEYVWNPPRILVYDLTVSPPRQLRELTFPASLVTVGSTFLNDLVVDVINDFAFISDAGGAGGLYAYDYGNNQVRYWSDPSMQVESNATTFTIQGSGTYEISVPLDGIALDTNVSRVYYCALSGFTVYSVSADLFRQWNSTDQQLHESIQNHGEKVSQSDGITIDSLGHMYYGDIEGNAIAMWNTADGHFSPSNQQQVLQGDRLFQWQDTFAFDEQGHILVVTNRLQLFPTDYDFTGHAGANFRIVSLATGTLSYMSGALGLHTSSPPHTHQ